MVHLNSMLLMPIIETREGRNVVVVGAKGTCLNADIDEFMLLKFIGDKVEVVHSIDQECKKCVLMEENKNVLCLKMNKGLHRCTKSTLL